MGAILTLGGSASDEFSFEHGDVLVEHTYGDHPWTAGRTGLSGNQTQSLPWRVLLSSERDRNVNAMNRLQCPVVTANTEAQKNMMAQLPGLEVWMFLQETV